MLVEHPVERGDLSGGEAGDLPAFMSVSISSYRPFTGRRRRSSRSPSSGASACISRATRSGSAHIAS